MDQRAVGLHQASFDAAQPVYIRAHRRPYLGMCGPLFSRWLRPAIEGKKSAPPASSSAVAHQRRRPQLAGQCDYTRSGGEGKAGKKSVLSRRGGPEPFPFVVEGAVALSGALSRLQGLDQHREGRPLRTSVANVGVEFLGKPLTPPARHSAARHKHTVRSPLPEHSHDPSGDHATL